MQQLVEGTLGRRVAAEHAAVDAHDQPALGRTRRVARVASEGRLGIRLDRSCALVREVCAETRERLPHEPRDLLRVAVVVVEQELTARRRGVEALRRSSEVAARSLSCDAPIEAPLRVVLASLVRLVERNRNEVLAQERQELLVGEGRPPVDHAVVSRAAERVAVHGPDEQRALRREGLALSGEQVDAPRNRAPGLGRVGPEALEQGVVLRVFERRDVGCVLANQSGGCPCGEEGSSEERERHGPMVPPARRSRDYAARAIGDPT